jgi:transketolase
MVSLSRDQGHEGERVAGKMRRQIVEMYTLAGGGHFGGSMSVVEILVTLYGAVVRVNPADPEWSDRDRVVLSKGHACGALCPVLAHHGFFEEALLDTFNKLDSPFGMHPDMNKIPGCDMSTGSLGHGLAIGIGMALAARADGKDYRVYVVLGDGECQEGTVWEAASVASHLRVDNLTAFVDRNWVSLDGPTEEINALEPFHERWRSFGWHVVEVDGHDIAQLYDGVEQAHATAGQPTVILANTVKGKGVSFMEHKYEYHYASLSQQELTVARAETGSGER